MITMLMTLIAIFNDFGMSWCVIAGMSLYIIVFQVTIGTLAFIHAQETCVDVAVGLSLNTLTFHITISSIIVNNIILKYGTTYCYILYAVSAAVGIVYMQIFLKDTSMDPK